MINIKLMTQFMKQKDVGMTLLQISKKEKKLQLTWNQKLSVKGTRCSIRKQISDVMYGVKNILLT